MIARTILVCVFFATVAVSSSRAQGDAGVFTEVSRSDSASIAADATILRDRWVTINHDQVRRTPGQLLVLNLFADTRLVAVLDRVEPTRTGYVWVGRLPDVERSSVTLAVTDGIMAGSVTTPDVAYAIRFVGGTTHAIQQINLQAFPPELPPVVVTPAEPDRDAHVVVSDDGSIIDVLVVYTPAARIARGGTSAIEALIDLGISETNQAYANSGAIQRLRLLNKQEVSYTESGNMSSDLSRLRGTSDGYLDTVHSLRDAYGADVVQLIEDSPDFCGIAYLMTSVSTSFASNAFGITHHSCISPNYSFAHEMGHNMGLRHDTYMDSGMTPYSYSHGYVNQAAFVSGASSSKRWRDIMAYNDQCAASGFNCSRIQYFANPTNVYTSDTMGNASTADGVHSLDNTRTTVANFRASVTIPTLTMNDVTVAEGNSGTRNATFTVSLSASSASPVTVQYATADGTAIGGSGADYGPASGTLTISAGSTSGTIAVTVNGDAIAETAETFTLNLQNASGATIIDGQGVGTITNDDLAFTDDPLSSGIFIKRVHITELRTAVNDARIARGLSAFSFTDPTLTAESTIVKGVHITELRSALAQAYSAAGQTPPTYTDPTLTAGVFFIKAVHIAEIRAAVAGLQ